MKLVEVDVDVVVDKAVAARAVDLVRVFPIMRIFLLVRVPLRNESLGNRRTGVGGYGGPCGPFRGGRRGEFSNGKIGDGERPRRPYERRSGIGQMKSNVKGLAVGTEEQSLMDLLLTEEATNETGKNEDDENPAGEEGAADGNKESPANEAEEKEPEDKEMTLEEYENVLEDKRKALQALKTKERKFDAKAFASMQPLSSKKDNDDVFIKLSSDKDQKEEAAEKEEKAKKSVSINEFLKPAEGERYYSPGGRGRGRGRRSRRGYGGNYEGNVPAPIDRRSWTLPILGWKVRMLWNPDLRNA